MRERQLAAAWHHDHDHDDDDFQHELLHHRAAWDRLGMSERRLAAARQLADRCAVHQ